MSSTNLITSSAWARFYNSVENDFAEALAPQIRKLYEETDVAQTNKLVLDVCCGTGALARSFLDAGYAVVGVDLSAEMLRYARLNCAPFLQDGRARFVEADARTFDVEEGVGLAVCTHDSLELLESERGVRQCLERVHACLVDGGTFVFDLHTRRGFWDEWNTGWVRDTDRELIVARPFFDGGDRAFMRYCGFLRNDDGGWDRIEENRMGIVLDPPRMLSLMRATGWRDVRVASSPAGMSSGLHEDVSDAPRAFYVAGKG